jgi:hypothetical protein
MRGKEAEKRSSFWNQKLITKKSECEQFMFRGTVIIDNFPQHGA